MANIQEHLNTIKNAIYGKEVRGAIHDSIKQCYDDASVEHDNANMEVKLARGVYNTLNDRLDESDKIQEEFSSSLENKVNKTDKIKSNQLSTSSNSDKIHVENLGEDILEKLVPNANITISGVVEGKTITSEKYARNSVNVENTSFAKIKCNLINRDLLTKGFVNYTNGNIVTSDSYNSTDFVSIEPNKEYKYYNVTNAHFAFYDKDKKYISNTINKLDNPFTSPNSAYYIRVSLDAEQSKTCIICDVNIENPTQEYEYQLSEYFDVSKNIKDKSINVNKLTDEVAIFKRTKNLFAKSTVKENAFVSWVNGGIIDNTDYYASDFISVKPSTQYTFNCPYVHLAEYNIEKEFINGQNAITIGTITTSDNTNFIRISPRKADCDYSYFQFEEGSTLSPYTEGGVELVNNLGFKIVNIGGNTTNSKVSFYTSKIIATLGDSITNGNTWQPLVKDELGFSKVNKLGVGGSQIGGTYSDTKAFNSDERINEIPLDSDVITVMGGTNDWANDRPIGEKSYLNKDIATFYGACNVMFEKLINKFPDKIILCMGTPYGTYPNRVSFKDKRGLVNNLNLTTLDYGKVLMEVARSYGIPCVDIGGNAGWNEYNKELYITDDGAWLHPNQEGGKKIARLVISKLKEIEPIV